MSGLNSVTLAGNVGAEPEVRTTAGGTKVAKVSLATSRKYKGEEQTQWHRLTFFGAVVDVVEKYVHKGDKIGVTGRIEYSQTQDDKGNVRYWTDIIVNDLALLGGGQQAAPATAPASPFAEDSDLPFSYGGAR